eukprot:scpid57920/ scgid31598/ 
MDTTKADATCRERLQQLRAQHRSSHGSDAALNEAMRKFADRCGLTAPSSSSAKRVGPERRRGCCACCSLFWLLRLVAVGLTLWAVWSSSPALRTGVHAFVGKHSYHYFSRPTRFLTMPLLEMYPVTLKRWFHSSHCLVNNPYFKHTEPSVSELSEETAKEVNCACHGIHSADVLARSAWEALTPRFLDDGGVPSVLSDHGRSMSAPEFAAWLTDTEAILNQTTCMVLTHTGDDNIDYSSPAIRPDRVTQGRGKEFLGVSWMMCPGAIGASEVTGLANAIPEAEAAGLRAADDIWLTVAMRGDRERRANRATPFDMSSLASNLLVRVSLIVGQVDVRLSPANCQRCMPVEVSLTPGLSLLYNSSVWLHDQIVHNAHPDVSVTVTTAYRWPVAENAWVNDMADRYGEDPDVMFKGAS